LESRRKELDERDGLVYAPLKADNFEGRFRVFKRIYKWRTKRTTKGRNLEPSDIRARISFYCQLMFIAGMKKQFVRIAFGDETHVLRNNFGGHIMVPEGGDEFHGVANTKTAYTVLLYAVAFLTPDGLALDRVEYLPPLMIIRGKGKADKTLELKDGVYIAHTADQWIKSHVYEAYIREVVKPDDATLLVHDCFYAHKLPLLQGIETVTLPGGTTKYVQVHDVVINAAFKVKLQTSYHDYTRRRALRCADDDAAGQSKEPSLEDMRRWIGEAYTTPCANVTTRTRLMICGSANSNSRVALSRPSAR
jgi:hypothetical protein